MDGANVIPFERSGGNGGVTSVAPPPPPSIGRDMILKRIEELHALEQGAVEQAKALNAARQDCLYWLAVLEGTASRLPGDPPS